jgi:hypothetical protein
LSVPSERLSSAEVTAGVVSKAANTGAPLCIPGALDVRVARSARGTPGAIAGNAAAVANPATGTASDRERREYQLAGGGAPGERGITRRGSVIERLCQLLRWRPGRQAFPTVQK